jgi:hypothetical protein
MVHAVLARLCYSGVRRVEISHAGGRTFTLAPTGSCAEFCGTERNWYPLGIVQCWNVLEFQAVRLMDEDETRTALLPNPVAQHLDT